MLNRSGRMPTNFLRNPAPYLPILLSSKNSDWRNHTLAHTSLQLRSKKPVLLSSGFHRKARQHLPDAEAIACLSYPCGLENCASLGAGDFPRNPNFGRKQKFHPYSRKIPETLKAYQRPAKARKHLPTQSFWGCNKCFVRLMYSPLLTFLF